MPPTTITDVPVGLFTYMEPRDADSPDWETREEVECWFLELCAAVTSVSWCVFSSPLWWYVTDLSYFPAAHNAEVSLVHRMLEQARVAGLPTPQTTSGSG